ncbi:MAG TPA: hypothetical protein VL993_12115 [Stellaceae bacterium]|nr:hypothetical protein [Stellaceae bacterium]
MRLPVVALAFLLLAACQPIPHPFADQAASSLPMRPQDSVGVAVLPVAAAGAPEERPLADALVHALIGQDVLASTDAASRSADRLSTSVTTGPMPDGRLHIVLAWRLADAGGKKLGDGTVEADEPQTAWKAGDPALATSLATDAAQKIASALAGSAPPVPAANAPALISVRGVSGAPGDGNTSLAAAIVRALGRDGISVATGDGAAPLALTCVVAVAPAQAGKQQVQIHWLVSKRDGGALGHADQQNAVPAGSLNGAWSDIAFAVAAAAAPGIVDLIHKAEPMVADAEAAALPAGPKDGTEPPPLAIPPRRSADAAAPAPSPVVPVAATVLSVAPPRPPAAPGAKVADNAALPPPSAAPAGSAQFLVQFGAYRDAAAGAKDCAAAAKLAPARVVQADGGGPAFYRCRTVAPMSRAEASALVATASAAGHAAVMVPLPTTH